MSDERTHRWNITRDGNDLLVCEGDHHNSQDCEYVRYVPATALEAAQRENAELRDKLAKAEEAYKDLRNEPHK